MFNLTDAHRVHLVRSLVEEAESSAWPDDYRDRALLAVLNTPAGELEDLPNEGDVDEDDPAMTDAQRVMLSIDFFGIPEDLTGWDEPVARG